MTAKFWLWAVVQAIGAALLIGAVAWWVYGNFYPGKPLWSWNAMVVFVPAGMVLCGVLWVVFVSWPRFVREQGAQLRAIGALSPRQAEDAWEQVVARARSGAGATRIGPEATPEELQRVRGLLPAGAIAFFSRHASVEWVVSMPVDEDIKLPASATRVACVALSMVRSWPEFPMFTIVGENTYRSVIAVDVTTGQSGVYRRPKPGRPPRVLSAWLMPEMPSLAHVVLMLEATASSTERMERKFKSIAEQVVKK